VSAALTGGTIAAGASAAEAPADSPWKVRSTPTASGCALVEHFSRPRRADVPGTCETTSQASESCDDAKGHGATEKPPGKLEYIAFLAKSNSDCATVKLRDLVATRVFGRDKNYLPILKRAASIIEKELKKPSADFLEFPQAVRRDIAIRGISAAQSLRFVEQVNENIDRYALSLQVESSPSSIVLLFNEDGSDVEWTVMMQ